MNEETLENQDLESAESGLLSCFFADPIKLGDARRKLPSGSSFSREHLGMIYDEMIAHVDSNQPLELVTFTERLRDRSLLDKVGGPSLLADILMFVPSAVHFEFYLDIVWKRWQLRKIRAAAVSIISGVDTFGNSGAENIAEFVGNAETQLFDCVKEVAAGQKTGTGLVDSLTAVQEWVDHLEVVMRHRGKVIGLTTGIHEIDQTFHGLDDEQGEILVVAGRPGQGKTAFGISVESHWIDQGYPGLVISAEMSRVQWSSRLVLGGAKIDTSKAITGHFHRWEQDAMLVRAAKIQAAPRLINADSYITTADLRTQAQIAKRTHGIRWMIVDHLTLIKPVTSQGQKEERLGIKETMEALQWIKKELKVMVLLLVQMSRESDRNIGKPPVMADLAGSAAIEQYADHIIFLYRPSYYVPWHRLTDNAREAWIENTRLRRERNPDHWAGRGKYTDEDGGVHRHDYEEDAILCTRKNRRGPTPEVHVRFQPEFTWYSSRMPCLNSNDVLDQQFGSYSTPRKASQDSGDTEVKPRRKYKTEKNSGESMDDVFGNSDS